MEQGRLLTFFASGCARHYERSHSVAVAPLLVASDPRVGGVKRKAIVLSHVAGRKLPGSPGPAFLLNLTLKR